MPRRLGTCLEGTLTGLGVSMPQVSPALVAHVHFNRLRSPRFPTVPACLPSPQATQAWALQEGLG